MRIYAWALWLANLLHVIRLGAWLKYVKILARSLKIGTVVIESITGIPLQLYR